MPTSLDTLQQLVGRSSLQQNQQQSPAVGSSLLNSYVLNRAVSQYPWLKRFGNIALTMGNGPYESESYMANAPDNPVPGRYTVQIRNDALKRQPGAWPALLGREGLDWLARSDPEFQRVAKAFTASMSDKQKQNSWRRWNADRNNKRVSYADFMAHHFDDFMQEAEAQEYIGGFLVPEAAPGWTGPQGEGQFTPEQIKMLDGLRAYLNK